MKIGYVNIRNEASDYYTSHTAGDGFVVIKRAEDRNAYVHDIYATSPTLSNFTAAPIGSTLTDLATGAKWKMGASSTFYSIGEATVLADPGDEGAISVIKSGVVPIVTAGAETRTLAIPTFVGQVITLNLKTDGGDAVVTAASGINQTGNNTMTLADAGDEITLKGMESGSALVWRVVSNDGVALSTV